MITHPPAVDLSFVDPETCDIQSCRRNGRVDTKRLAEENWLMCGVDFGLSVSSNGKSSCPVSV